MLKKILALIVLSSFLLSCGTSKSRVKTSKNGTARTTRTSRNSKPSIRTTVDSKTGTASSSGRTETLESTSKTVVYAEVVKAYIEQFKETAKDNMKRHGIPASITLAQGILESGAGRGTLCQSANNHFGIKCHNDWTGPKVYHDDDSEQECFRKYSDPADSYNDHSLFLTTRSRYAALFKLDKDDYEGWAHGLKAAGYATDPKYPAKLIGLIQNYDLAKYDAEVLNKKYTAPTPKPQTQASAPVASVPAPVKQQPAYGTYTVEKGDTLYSISKKHNLTVDELMKLNGMSGNSLSIGQVLKIK
ncbi:glucosaminidase domain-containing protein [Flavobacterium sp. DG1-102-2]|uniref:glucosaminidase domain-containing protein n=1 Tax=Flavobacterium sp. DG1-102-2 TaxID=3081663 RepID=UPI002949DBB8|nr:glucosaminidase domain-containing protein [Flavobacterium sp. DG1-102-2]MDV6168759.1 glucosaminidase domain-containing protein [Flavobacterium sp. DG1-102-2]